MKDKFIKVEALWKKEKLNWIGMNVLYTSLHNVLENVQMNENGENSIKFVDVIEKLTQAEVAYCNQKCSLPADTKPLDINCEKELISLVEKDIKSTCEGLLEYHDALNSVGTRTSSIQNARTIKLGEIIRQDKTKFEMCKQEIVDAQRTEKQMYATCMNEILQSAEYLSKIIEKYRLRLQPKRNEEKFSNLVSRCEALSLKILSMTAKLKKSLYTRDSVIALQSIKAELLKQNRKYHQEIVATEQQLSEFKNLGDEFNAIVKEYNQLQEDIEKRTWALNKLHQ